jgi:hypothetical protein
VAFYAGLGSWLLAAALQILGGPKPLGWVCLILGIGFLILAGLWWYVGHGSEEAPSQTGGRTAPEDKAPPPKREPIRPSPEEAAQASQHIFEEAPPELADLSAASLQEIFAGRTHAQADQLMEHHVGKPVRVSGVVESVSLSLRIPQVHLRSAAGPLLQLFFDAEDYDAKPVLLALNAGDNVFVSGQIWKFGDRMVSIDRCKVIDVRAGPVAKQAMEEITGEPRSEEPLTPEAIFALFEDKTDLQAAKLLKAHRGTRMQVSGNVLHVASHEGENLSVTFLRGGAHGITMMFSPKYAEKLSALHRGDRITVEGDLFLADSSSLALTDCELVDE